MSGAGEMNENNRVNGPWDKIKGCDSMQLRLPKSSVNDVTIPNTMLHGNNSENLKIDSKDLPKGIETINNRILNSKLNANAAEFIPLSNQNLDNVNYEDCSHDEVATYLRDTLKYLILNPGIYDEIVQPLYEVIEPYSTNEPALKKFVSIILEECIEEPNLRYSGARMCSDLTQKFGDPFRKVLLTRCQEEHVNLIGNCQDANFVNRIQGFGMLLAELFLQVKINGNSIMILGHAVLKLLQGILQDSEKGLKSICQILKLTGSKLEKIPNSKPLLDELFNRLRSICEKYVDLDPNLKIMVLKVLEMRATNWGEENSEVENQPDHSNSTPENQKGVEYYNDPVFFGPDGKVISEEETSFLHESLPISEEPDDYVCDDDVMSDEVSDDYEQFLQMEKSRE